MTKQQPESCPYFVEPLKPKLKYEKSNPIVVPDNEIYTRKPLIPLGKFYPTYLIWVDDISSILKVFDATVLKCDQKIDRGIYNRQSKFLFVMNQNEKNLEKVGKRRSNEMLRSSKACLSELIKSSKCMVTTLQLKRTLKKPLTICGQLQIHLRILKMSLLQNQTQKVRFL